MVVSLSCDCASDYEWYYVVSDVERSAATPFRCYGCGGSKPMLEPVRHVYSFEIDEDGDEGEEEMLGRLCEECSGLYDRLLELGFCLEADQGFVKEAMREYREEYVK